MTDWLTGWLIDWLLDWLIDWLIDCLIDWLIDWMIDSLIKYCVTFWSTLPKFPFAQFWYKRWSLFPICCPWVPEKSKYREWCSATLNFSLQRHMVIPHSYPFAPYLFWEAKFVHSRFHFVWWWCTKSIKNCFLLCWTSLLL